MRRRLLMFFMVALVTAMSTTAWLYEGDLGAAVGPMVHPGNGVSPGTGEVVPAAVPTPVADE
jgi:hypothetical protein